MKRYISNKPFSDQTYKEILGIKGDVRQVTQVCYEVRFKNNELITGKINNEIAYPEKNFNYIFNKHGIKVESVQFGSTGKKWTRYLDNKEVAESIQYDKQGKIYQTSSYTYDDNNKTTEYVTLNADGSMQFKHVYKYNTNGKLTEDIAYFKDTEKSHGRTVREYNESGELTAIISYKNDAVDHKYTLIYNEAGQKTDDILLYTAKGSAKFNHHHKYKYNSHGDMIEVAHYNTDGSLKEIFTYSHEYESDGKKILAPRKIQDPYELNEDESEELEFDSHGNWTKRTLYFNKKPNTIYVRQYIYMNEPLDKKLEHPLENVVEEEVIDDHTLDELDVADAKWLGEGTLQPENFPLVRYYAMQFKEMPSVTTFTDVFINALKLLETLKEEAGAYLLHSYSTAGAGERGTLHRYTLGFRENPGYMLNAVNIVQRNVEEFSMSSSDMSLIDDIVYTSQMILYTPGEAYGKKDEYFEESISEFIEDSMLTKKPDKPYINMIEVSGNGFVMREHAVDDDFEIKDLDVNYGYGFEEFHEELMHRFNTSTKGLVLFHGAPGTGKTYYIRHLLRKMVSSRKVVIYMPPNMVDHLVEPAFMTFLIEEVKNWSAEGNFCVLLIEDAEPLLTKRKEGVRIQGVTNLLNMSDGLLNDMLNLQIICTFNVGLTKLDSALLRPGRLIARKEFKALSHLDANLLAQRLGIKHHFKKSATLGEIYAMRKDGSTLIHDVEADDDASDMIDDLL